MEYIRITKENISKEHICCAIAKNDDIQVSSKKSWMLEQMDAGLRFVKSAERGKCFIEYIPAENAWIPVEAPGYMHINCFWVSGSLKGHGYANDLLDICVKDAKEHGCSGLTVLSSVKKMPFLSDPKYLAYKGFSVADSAGKDFRLLYLPFDENAPVPQFTVSAKEMRIEEQGYVLYYTNQCPYTAKYVPVIEAIAREHNAPFKAIHITDSGSARALPCPVTTYAFFRNGVFYTNEVFSEKKFLKLLEEDGLL